MRAGVGGKVQRSGLEVPALLERRHAAPALAVLFLSGGILGLGSLILPHWTGVDVARVGAPALAGPVVAAVLFAARDRLPFWAFHVFLALGTAGVSYGVAVSGDPAASATYSLFYVWVALYACLFFSWAAAAGHAAFVAVAYAGALRIASSEPIAGQWLIAIGVLVVSGGVVGWLGRQAQGHYRRLYEGELAVVTQLEEAERVKGDLVAIASHELRTPLTSIRGYARTLLVHGERLTPAEREEFLHHIDAQSARLARVVDNLLLASRASHADVAATADVQHVVAQAVEELRSTWAEPPPVDVRCPDGVLVEISEDALHQVVLNLVGNAVKFNAGAEPVRVLATSSPDEVTLEVRNAAADIDPAECERIFEPFVRLDPVDQHTEGVGLGLHIVRRLVEAHRGSVQAISEHGEMRLQVRLRPARRDDLLLT
jgi:signal transduction histidine kinase